MRNRGDECSDLPVRAAPQSHGRKSVGRGLLTIPFYPRTQLIDALIAAEAIPASGIIQANTGTASKKANYLKGICSRAGFASRERYLLGTVPQTEDNGTYINLLSLLLLDRHQHGQRSQDSDRTALVAQR